MLKITKHTEHRELTLDEFIKQKNSEPYSIWRHVGKTCNFLLIFGGSEMLFAEQALETTWTPEQCWNYINENNCEEELEQVKRKYKGISEEEAPYVAVATRIRDNFFKGYEGLWKRIEREVKYAHDHGYVRSPFGHVRKEIELMLEGEYDLKESSKMLRNLENISKNSNIQNMEASITKRVMYEMQNWLRDNGYKSRLWAEVHDSIDIFVYKPELHDVLAHLKHLCEREIPEFLGTKIPLKIDCEISDLTKGQYYKGGSSPESYGINWNEL